VVVDGAGNVYVTGDSDTDWSTQSLAPDGTLRWDRRLSGQGVSYDLPRDMALLPDGNLVVTGTMQNIGDGLTNDAETVAYDAQGALVWRARFSDTATSHEEVSDLDVDAAGRIVLTGSTARAPGGYDLASPFTLRYDRAGALMQTIRSDGGSSVDVAPGGGFHLAGFFPEPSPSAVSRFDAAGNRLWAAPLAGDANEFLGDPKVAVDSTGAVTVAATASDPFNGRDSYLTIRFDADGRELFRHRFDGSEVIGERDHVVGVAIDANDATLVTGTSQNGYPSSGGTGTDFLTLKFAVGAAPALFAPSGLQATAVSRSKIRLQWQDNAGSEDGFRIERCADVGSGLMCTNFAELARVGRDATGFVDSRLTRSTTYRYRVRAFNAGGASTPSNTATASTPRF
jgi:hypothetical protein